jgi:hypothetical protein
MEVIRYCSCRLAWVGAAVEVYPEERSEDFYPAERSEDVVAD